MTPLNQIADALRALSLALQRAGLSTPDFIALASEEDMGRMMSMMRSEKGFPINPEDGEPCVVICGVAIGFASDLSPDEMAKRAVN